MGPLKSLSDNPNTCCVLVLAFMGIIFLYSVWHLPDMESDFDQNLVTWVLHYESLDGLNLLFLLASFDAAQQGEKMERSADCPPDSYWPQGWAPHYCFMGWSSWLPTRLSWVSPWKIGCRVMAPHRLPLTPWVWMALLLLSSGEHAGSLLSNGVVLLHFPLQLL